MYDARLHVKLLYDADRLGAANVPFSFTVAALNFLLTAVSGVDLSASNQIPG